MIYVSMFALFFPRTLLVMLFGCEWPNRFDRRRKLSQAETALFGLTDATFVYAILLYGLV